MRLSKAQIKISACILWLFLICDQNNNFWFERSWRRNTILCVELFLFDDVFVCIFAVENEEMERIINSQMRTVRENRFRTWPLIHKRKRKDFFMKKPKIVKHSSNTTCGYKVLIWWQIPNNIPSIFISTSLNSHPEINK